MNYGKRQADRRTRACGVQDPPRPNLRFLFSLHCTSTSISSFLKQHGSLRTLPELPSNCRAYSLSPPPPPPPFSQSSTLSLQLCSTSGTVAGIVSRRRDSESPARRKREKESCLPFRSLSLSLDLNERRKRSDGGEKRDRREQLSALSLSTNYKHERAMMDWRPLTV